MTHEPLPKSFYRDWTSQEKGYLYSLLMEGVPVLYKHTTGYARLEEVPPRSSTHILCLQNPCPDRIEGHLKKSLVNYSWMARDMDGSVCFFKNKPEIVTTGSCWMEEGGEYLLLGDLHGYTVGNTPWDQSLQRIHEGDG